jgi:hypothetical protein
MASRSVGLALRWVARGWSLLSIISVVIFAVAERFRSQGPVPTAQEMVGLALFPIGVCIGLALAWFREGFGGTLALGCLVAFYAWNMLRLGHLPGSPFILFVGAPSILFIAASLQNP